MGRSSWRSWPSSASWNSRCKCARTWTPCVRPWCRRRLRPPPPTRERRRRNKGQHMFTSFSTALSALNATSTAIDVVGNNLANLNTPGFKASVVSFHDLVTQSLGAGLGETQVGFGVGSPTTLREFRQGAQQTTNGPLDAMIQGDGFFVVSGANSAVQYTRGGNFEVDENGHLTTA